VNEALALTDSLMHCSVEGTLAAPPTAPEEGAAWIVAAAPSGAWTGRAGAIAMRQSGNWLFAEPREGMRIYDRSAGLYLRFTDSWQSPVAPAEPSGGTIVDAEARVAIDTIIAALRTAGILSGS